MTLIIFSFLMQSSESSNCPSHIKEEFSIQWSEDKKHTSPDNQWMIQSESNIYSENNDNHVYIVNCKSKKKILLYKLTRISDFKWSKDSGKISVVDYPGAGRGTLKVFTLSSKNEKIKITEIFGIDSEIMKKFKKYYGKSASASFTLKQITELNSEYANIIASGTYTESGLGKMSTYCLVIRYDFSARSSKILRILSEKDSNPGVECTYFP
ncbi:MAG: hypothetical protein KYX64_09825 [Sphingopyxis sp.]|nr:hypothetical protein [Sphingopyxis sp.]